MLKEKNLKQSCSYNLEIQQSSDISYLNTAFRKKINTMENNAAFL